MEDRERPQSQAPDVTAGASYEAPAIVALGDVATDTLQTGIPGG